LLAKAFGMVGVCGHPRLRSVFAAHAAGGLRVASRPCSPKNRPRRSRGHHGFTLARIELKDTNVLYGDNGLETVPLARKRPKTWKLLLRPADASRPRSLDPFIRVLTGCRYRSVDGFGAFTSCRFVCPHRRYPLEQFNKNCGHKRAQRSQNPHFYRALCVLARLWV
jgi:hypothetical protein